jgi:putative nucleotidyltransferase with HDIG domain
VQSPAAAAIAAAETRDVHEFHADVLSRLLGFMKARDPGFPKHGARTAQYAVALARGVGLGRDEWTDLALAALLHDIGKLTLPKEVLEKDGPLTAAEYALVQSHPRAGAELLESFPFLRTAGTVIALHHERWDGAGYPYGVRGSLIPFSTRILAVADTYDTVTSDRPYGRGRDPESALHLLQLIAGSQLDPALVKAFVRLMAQADPMPDCQVLKRSDCEVIL